MFKKFFLAGIIFFIHLQVSWAEEAHLTVILDWLVNPDHALLFVAQEQGFFAKHQLTVELIAPTNPDDGLKLVAAKHADIAVTYQPTLLQALDKKLPLIRIASLVAQPLNCTIANPSIKTLEDLKGKRISSADPVSTLLLGLQLKKVNLTLKDIHLITVGYTATNALLAGKLDAMAGAMRNVQPLQLKYYKKNMTVFPIEAAGIPTYDELILITHSNAVNDPRLKQFVQALNEASVYLHQHPQSCWLLFAKENPQLNTPLNREMWMATLPYISLHPSNFNRDNYEKFMRFSLKNAIITHPLDTPIYAVNLLQ